MTEHEFGIYHNKQCTFFMRNGEKLHGFIVRYTFPGAPTKYYFIDNQAKPEYLKALEDKNFEGMKSLCRMVDIADIKVAVRLH